MRSIPVPPRVLQALQAGDPYTIVRDVVAAPEAYQKATGPVRQVAERLVQALRGFPPPSQDFDIIDIRESFSVAGFKVTVGSGTLIRVTVVAIYREAQGVVSIQGFEPSPRHVEKVKRGKSVKKGERS